MERRNFFKALAGVYAGATTFFSCKYFEKRDNANKYIIDRRLTGNPTYLRHIEFPIVYHCNLNCAYCDHFAPLAPEYFMPLEVFKKDILKLKELTNGKIDEILLLGGEPLLHPDIEKFLEIARENFPDAFLKILTNGLLLKCKDEDFWNEIARSKTEIRITNYVLYNKVIDLNYINKISKKYNVSCLVYSPTKKFDLVNLSKNKKCNLKQKYNSCSRKIETALLDNGILYSCCIAQGIQKFFNKKFPKYAIPFAQDDTLDIHKVQSLQEILDFLEKPKTYCTYCHYEDNTFEPSAKKWKLSKRELSEWYVK